MLLEVDENVVWEYGQYRGTGGPMQFRLVSPTGRVPRGWVVIGYRGSTDRGPLRLLLRVERLDGSLVDIPLPASEGQAVSALVHLPPRIASLRLTPADAPDVCTIPEFAIREISRRAALARIVLPCLRRILREPRTVPALTRHALALWRREGWSGLRESLLLGAGVSTGRGRAAQPPPAVPLAYRPLVSVIVPSAAADPARVRGAVGSVERQTYTNWELCACADGSTAMNEALRAARGDYVTFLDADDELTPDALWRFVATLNETPTLDVLYSDEDTIDAGGRPSEPSFKPDWSPELLRGVMYVRHLLMIRHSLLTAVDGLDSTYDGVQDFELMLRLSEHTDRVHHVRAILYHCRRATGGSTAAIDPTSDVDERQVAAVNVHLRRTGVRAIAKPHPLLPHRVVLQPAPRSTPWPAVSIVISTRDVAAEVEHCLESLSAITVYPDFEVIVSGGGRCGSSAKAMRLPHSVARLTLDAPFSVARANNLGVAQARGLYVVLLNAHTEVLDPEWLQTLVFHMELPNVGVVGPLLVYPDGTVRHAGLALGPSGVADRVMHRFPADADGYGGSLCCTREVMAVTAACLVTSRRHYLDIGGLNEYYQRHHGDVDFCLRTWRAARRVLYTPRTRLIDHEGARREPLDDDLDQALFRDAWGDVIARGDRFHDPRVPGYSESARR